MRPAVLLLATGAALVAAPTASAAPPPNDALTDARVVEGATGTVSGANVDATKEPGEPAHAGNAGGRSVWFRWTAPSDGQVRWTTDGSGFDTLLAVYQGPAVTALTTVASDDDSGDSGAGALSFRATRAAVYVIAVDGFEGKAGRISLRWGPAPPNDNFRDAAPIAGWRGSAAGRSQGATRELGEPGFGNSIWYRWTAPAAGRIAFLTERASAELTAYTGTELAYLTPVGRSSGYALTLDAAAGATYSIRVGDLLEGISLVWQRPPPNDAFAGRRRLSGTRGSVSATNIGADRDGGSRFPPASIWYSWRAPRSGPIVFSTNGSSFDTVLAVYRGGSLRSLRLLRVDDDGGAGVTSVVRFRATRGTVYTIAVGGFEGDTGRVRLHWQPPPRG